jgi:hypothetical protein
MKGMKLTDERISELRGFLSDLGCSIVYQELKETNDIILALRELQQLRSQSTWIAVTERLPEGFEFVLVSGKQRDCDVDYRCTAAYREDGFFDGFGNQMTTVTHWRPLPAAPQEGTK